MLLHFCFDILDAIGIFGNPIFFSGVCVITLSGDHHLQRLQSMTISLPILSLSLWKSDLMEDKWRYFKVDVSMLWIGQHQLEQ